MSDVLNLTPEQAEEALKAGGKLYEMAVHQRNMYRWLLAAVVREYGDDELTLPKGWDSIMDDEPIFQIEPTKSGSTTIRLVHGR